MKLVAVASLALLHPLLHVDCGLHHDPVVEGHPFGGAAVDRRLAESAFVLVVCAVPAGVLAAFADALDRAREGKGRARLRQASGLFRLAVLSATAVLKGLKAEELAQEWPEAHDVGDIYACARFANVPDLVNGRVWRSKVEVLVQHGGDDGEDTQTHDAEKQQFLLQPHLGLHKEWNRNGEHGRVGRDVERGLCDGIVLICRALHVLRVDGPVVLERSSL